jgi:hypothetical protein
VKKLITVAIAAAAMAFAGTAGAALVPGVFDQNNTGCPVSVAQNGWLHLEKNCANATPASAFGTITDAKGQTFSSASFTLKSASQCQGGSPRFNIFTASTTFFLGCNNVTPVMNADGTATYTFTAATIAAGGNQVPVPTGTITGAEVLIDIQGTADVKNVTLNGRPEDLKQGHRHHHKHHGDDRGHHHHHDHENDQGQDND